jgi:hypothetical protein
LKILLAVARFVLEPDAFARFAGSAFFLTAAIVIRAFPIPAAGLAFLSLALRWRAQ